MIEAFIAEADKLDLIYPSSAILRFWSRVEKKGWDDCWLWKKGCFGDGYGAFHVRKEGIMKTVGAHKFCMEIELNRRLKDGEWALHTCDNPPCCNPKHLYVGDYNDNARDRQVRGRMSRGKKHSLLIKRSPGIIAQRGEGNHHSKLTNEQVLEMRRLYDSGEMCKYRIAKTFKIDGRTATAIVLRQAWKHLP